MLRPGLRWILGLSLLSSGLALHWAGEPTGPKLDSHGLDVHRERFARVDRIGLPERLAALNLERAETDPFELPSLPPVAIPAAAPAQASPLPLGPPVSSYRYLGQLLDPQGKRMVYLAGVDNKEALVAPGARLDGGYLVEAITASDVMLFHELSHQRTSIPIPSNQS
jgi:hypothetical protein